MAAIHVSTQNLILALILEEDSKAERVEVLWGMRSHRLEGYLTKLIDMQVDLIQE